MLTLLTIVALAFGFLCLLFRPLELVFPAKPDQRFFRPAWITDLCFFIGYYTIWGIVVIWLLVQLKTWLGGTVPGAFRDSVAEQPWWLQAVEVILLSDFFMYWGHRIQHQVGFLWRFHAVHHSTEHMDWLAAHREHPLDSIYSLTLVNLPPMLLGFPLETMAGFLLFRGLWATYLHSNVRLPLGPFRFVLGAPELHHWHHSNIRDAGNYANFAPIMDLIFGTYHCPDHEPEKFGLKKPLAKTYVGHLVQPFLPRGKMRAAQSLAGNEPGRLQAGHV